MALFDLILLSQTLTLTNYVRGFKTTRSNDMCTMVLKELIAYYVNNGNSVYFTFLDASKAFDRVSPFDNVL